jgi:hypothetical protein
MATSSSARRPALNILNDIICPSLIGVFRYSLGAITYNHRLFMAAIIPATHSAPITLVITVVSKIYSILF